MKFITLFRSSLCCLLLVVLAEPGTLAQRKRQVAVLDFNFNTVDVGLARKAFGNIQNLAQQISVKLQSHLTRVGTCHVIERQQLLQILREHRLGMDGILDPNTMAKVGKVLGADSFVLGNVTVFDVKGLPERGQRQSKWDPNRMSARLQVSFRVVDTTTAYVEMSQEATGVFPTQGAKRQSGTEKFMTDIFSSMADGVISGLGNDRRRPADPLAKPTDEQLKGVVEGAVDDVVGKISQSLDSHFSNARKNNDEQKDQPNPINGRVIEVNGPTVYITEINKTLVRRGDRLYVRRGRTRRDPNSGKEYKFTEKIGEVEIVEIQDELVVGSFSGSLQVKEGDIITNSESGSGATPMIRSDKPSTEPFPNPRPPKNPEPVSAAPKPAPTPVQPTSPGRRPQPTRPM